MGRLTFFRNFFLQFRRVRTTVIRFHETFSEEGWAASFYLTDLYASIDIRTKRLLPTNHYSRGAKLLYTIGFRAASESPNYIWRMRSLSLDLITSSGNFLIIDRSLNILLLGSATTSSEHHHCLRQFLGIDQLRITNQVRIAFIVIHLIEASMRVGNGLGQMIVVSEFGRLFELNVIIVEGFLGLSSILIRVLLPLSLS